MFHCIISWSHFETWHFLVTYTNIHKTLKKEKKITGRFDFVQNWCHSNYKAAEAHRSHLVRCWSTVLLCQWEHLMEEASPAIRHHFQYTVISFIIFEDQKLTQNIVFWFCMRPYDLREKSFPPKSRRNAHNQIFNWGSLLLLEFWY